MLLWLARRAWNLFWDSQGDCLGWRSAFLSCDFGLPRTRSSSVVHSGSLDSLHSSLGTSSFSAWALGLKWNEPNPLEPSGPTVIKWCFVISFLIIFSFQYIWLISILKIYLIYKYVYLKLKGSLLSPRKMKFKTRGIRGKLSLLSFFWDKKGE